MKTRKFPASAMQAVVGMIECERHKEGDKSAPLRMIARSAEPIDHWAFGPMIHDFDGMTHKARIAVDYLHDSKEIIGYVNQFAVIPEGLEMRGALTPFRGDDRATEIISKAAAGVPYEASLYWPSSKAGDTVIEIVGEGETATVNGKEWNGPLTIFRKWPCRGVAVCPHGADSDTRTALEAAAAAGSAEVEVEVVEKEDNEVKTESEKTAEAKRIAEEAAVAAEAKAKADAEAKAKAEADAKAQAEAAKVKTPADMFKEYVAEFGAKASEYFAAGLSLDDARKEHVKALTARITELEAAVASANKTIGDMKAADAGASPSKFQPTDGQGEQASYPFSDAEIEKRCKAMGITVEAWKSQWVKDHPAKK